MLHMALVSCWLLTAMPADSPTPAELSVYQAAAAKAGGDALAHIRLASWCEIHGMQVERHKHLGIALELSPDHPAVHGLLGQVRDNGEWRMPQAVVEDYRSNPEAKATLALYHARREKSPDTAQAHWQLAEWCEENGLKAEANAHLAAVVRLNPTREEAWRKLGYQRQKGRWTTTELAAADRAQADHQRKADAHWRPLLEKWSGWLAKKTKREEAEAALANVHDPLAVPSIWKVFIVGGPADQERAVRLLSRIDGPAASRALASLAVSGLTESVRNRSADALLKRDPREFAGGLISVIRDPIVYEVREVEGPGKPGELYVHGERMNRRFFYAAPPALATLRPTDIVSYDSYGLPVANRVVGYAYEPVGAAVNPLMMGAPDLSNAPKFMGQLLGPTGTALGQKMLQNQQNAINMGNTLGPGFMTPLTVPIPVGQLTMQAEQRAAASREQLLEDVAALDRYNRDVNDVNDRATEALAAALLETHGPKRKDWVKWWSELLESSTYSAPRPREQDKDKDPAQKAVNKRAMLPGFREGTSVWTLSGLGPVESLRTGDQVLTQDPDSGDLSYRPVLAIRHGMRQPIKTLAIGDSAAIEATAMERFWVAGKGWVLLGDLKPGDVTRSVSGLRRVTAVEDAGVSPVYHVRVGEGRGIIVGQFGVLAHGEQMVRPVIYAFDTADIADGSQSSR
jgi:hypothetical protein